MANIGGTTQRDTEVRLPRATRVRNKQPADQQVGLCLTALLSDSLPCLGFDAFVNQAA